MNSILENVLKGKFGKSKMHCYKQRKDLQRSGDAEGQNIRLGLREKQRGGC